MKVVNRPGVLRLFSKLLFSVLELIKDIERGGECQVVDNSKFLPPQLRVLLVILPQVSLPQRSI